MRPVSAVISVKHRPPAARRKVQSAAPRRSKRTDLLTNDRPDVSGDHVNGDRLTTTPVNSDGEDPGKTIRRVDAWKSKDEECDGRKEQMHKNMKTVEDRKGRRLDKWKTKGLNCVGNYEEDVEKTKVMEDKFKQQVLRLQQQLGLTAEGYVLPL